MNLGARLRAVSPYNTIAPILVLAVTALIVYPLGRMIGTAFWADHALSFKAVSDAWADDSLHKAVRDTALILGVATPLAVLIAFVFAWCNERTDARLGWVSDVLPMVPLLMPSIASVIGLVFLFAPRAGYANIFLRNVLGHVGIDIAKGPIDIYTRPGLICLYILFMVPFAYLPIAAALRNLDPGYEEAAQVAGSSVWRAARNVTIPAVLPAVASGALLSLVVGFALFTAPITVGPAARVDVLSLWVYRRLTEYPPHREQAIAVGLAMLAVILVAAALERRIRRAGHFATISGKGNREVSIRLGAYKWPARALMLVYIALTAVLPFLAMVYLSFQQFWTERVSWGGDLDNYRDAFVNDQTARAGLNNSLLLGAIGASISVVLIAMIARYMRRASRLVGSIVDSVTKLPATLSHLIIAIAFLVALGGAPFNLQGTLLILLLVYFVLNLPFGAVVTNAAYAQVGTELTDASRVCGAAPFRTFRFVELPLIRAGLVATWCLCFVLMAGELTASVILATGSNPVLGSVILGFYNNGNYGLVAALGVLMTLVTAVIVGAALWLGRRRVPVLSLP